MEAAAYATAGLLFVGLISGLGFLAVHYPRTYHVVSGWVAYVSLGITGALAFYSLGLLYAWYILTPFVPAAKTAAARSAIGAVIPPYVLSAVFPLLTLCLFGFTLISDRIDREKKEIEAARKARE